MFLLGSAVEAVNTHWKRRAKPIRILRIIDRLNIGGPSKHVTWLTAGVNNEQYETTLVTGTVPPGEGDMSYFALEAGIKPIVIKEMSRELSFRDITAIIKLIILMFRVKPDIVHTHKAKAGAAGRVAAFVYKWLTPSALYLQPRDCKVVHTFHGHIFHGYYGPRKTRLFIAIERMLAHITDCIIAISESQRWEINERYSIGKREQFLVIPLGIDLEEARAGRRWTGGDVGVYDDEVTIGAIGRLCEVKNHLMLLDSAAIVLSQYEDPIKARFVIVGDGHLRPELEKHAEELGISERVTFAGFRDDVVALYSDLDIIALTSVNEGTPLTLIEGMSAGRPVVATEVGGVADLMGAQIGRRDGFTIWEHGVTAPSRDPETFSLALRYLIDRPELRFEMGMRARNFVHSSLSRRRLVADIEELYGKLAGVEELQPRQAKAAAAAR